MVTYRPMPGVVTDSLAELHERFAPLREGSLADYIPQLALADPEAFGIALVSMEGHCYQAGTAQTPFTVQSVSKPFVYALALSCLGLDEVTRWVGTEPSGDAFNAISLEPRTGRPANAMINAGAIATTGLVSGATQKERFGHILDCLSRFAGRPLDVDEAVYASEAKTGDRNRALAFLMSSAGSLPGDPAEVVDTYFQQCSVRVTTADLAVMTATLANGGVNPVNGDTVVAEEVAVQVLSVMASCGMYDASGDWLLHVGLPAKSGVSGGLVAAGPGRFGVAVFSPLLDVHGNSVRGVAALRDLSERYGLHLMRRPVQFSPTLTRATADGDRELRLVARGFLDFTAVERLLHGLAPGAPEPGGRLVLDLTAVTGVDPFAARLLRAALARAERGGHPATLVGGGVLDSDPEAVFPG
ncbi:glutaminase A [Streptomyces sp. NBC_01465]|uniref:glutaminase A n=1 Tax=Streptomyces sp. NBC_01465 TaxID=2903878 RepID=UPI002E3025E2|nr:glutaminase A [Streptomyces sp. NBC_01465]